MSGQPRAWRKLRQDRSGMAGLLIVGVFLLAAAGVWFGAWGQDWAAADGGRWQAPGSEYWFGTNVLGQDIFERATSGRVAADKQQDLWFGKAIVMKFLAITMSPWSPVICRSNGCRQRTSHWCLVRAVG